MIADEGNLPGGSDLADAILTDHAASRLAVRGIEESAIRRVLLAPEAVRSVRPGRVVAQGLIGDNQLLRVFVDIDRRPAEVVTAYRTSKLRKYRNQP